jgi:hypothetical protein
MGCCFAKRDECGAAGAAAASGPAATAAAASDTEPLAWRACCSPLPVRCCCLRTGLLPVLAFEPLLEGAESPWLLLRVSEPAVAV